MHSGLLLWVRLADWPVGCIALYERLASYFICASPHLSLFFFFVFFFFSIFFEDDLEYISSEAIATSVWMMALKDKC